MMMDKKLKMDELDLVSGGMTLSEWDDYNRHYDRAIMRAHFAGNKELHAKLSKERIVIDKDDLVHEHPTGFTLRKDAPFLKWKLEDMPNVELVYKMSSRKAF